MMRRALFGLTLLARSAHVACSSTPRIFAPSQPLIAASRIALKDEQRHYLLSVMRMKVGDNIHVFNGVDGEWSASIQRLDKKSCELELVEQLRMQPDEATTAAQPILMFGVLKNARLPMLVEKCTELGVGMLLPVVTKQCAVRKLNVPRLSSIAVEAAEQSGRLTVPTVEEPLPSLVAALEKWDATAPLFVCDERGDAPALSEVDGLLASAAGQPRGLLIGPEGGFAREEFDELDRHAFVHRVSLGPNILRAETAALAACAILGDRLACEK